MSRLLLCIILLVAASITYSQPQSKLQIAGKPTISPDEIVSQRDVNGRFCAAIQVISDMDGFQYDSYNGVVKVKDLPGQDMVFLQPDERVLEIYRTGFKPLKIILLEIGIQLQPKQVWKLELIGMQKTSRVLPVTILVEPKDSRIYLDSKLMEEGPTFQVGHGVHQLRITKTGYQSLEQEIEISEKKAYFNFKLKEIEDAGLQVETTPAKAVVYIDNIKIGETPFSVFYPPGKYSIKIVKEGYINFEGNINISFPSTHKKYNLVENMGYLSINTNASAKVYLNNDITYQRENIKLPPQLVHIKVTQSKAPTLEKSVLLKKGEHLTFDLYPKIQTGTVKIAVTPFDARIILKGDDGEYFKAKGMKVFQNIPIGKYTLEVEKTGFEKFKESFVISVSQKIKKEVKLEKEKEISKIENNTSKQRYNNVHNNKPKKKVIYEPDWVIKAKKRLKEINKELRTVRRGSREEDKLMLEAAVIRIKLRERKK